MNKILSPAERRALKARAHPLKPTVMIGNDGLTAGVLQEIDNTLKAHELIKIRVDIEDADEREDLMGTICANTGSSAIDHIGKILVVYRERPQSERAKTGSGQGQGRNARKGGGAKGTGDASGQGGQPRKPGAKAGAVWTKVKPQQRRKPRGGGQGGGGQGGRGRGGQGGGQGGGGQGQGGASGGEG
ncbi:MAG TPA: YhbY family RNA-binding protein [Burkholderiales bacterium]|nr:YhbY family RNA-binding protein [Burkholderiales bacterium]